MKKNGCKKQVNGIIWKKVKVIGSKLKTTEGSLSLDESGSRWRYMEVCISSKIKLYGRCGSK